MKTSKEFTIKTKRDGQGYEVTGSIYASNWQEAKERFTDNVRNDLAKNDGVIYVDDEAYEAMKSEGHPFIDRKIEYEGPGYYNYDGGWMQPGALLDGEVIDTFSEDVYTYTIKRV